MNEYIQIKNWVPIVGKWDIKIDKITYLGPQDEPNAIPFGIVLCDKKLRNGNFKTKILIRENARDNSGRLLFGYNAESMAYLTFGLGGYEKQFVLDEFRSGVGWQALLPYGTKHNISQSNAEYFFEVHLDGQRVSASVDGVQIFIKNLGSPLGGDQVGLFAWGNGQVIFENPRIFSKKPKVFIVMQFGEPYDSLYSQVIHPIVINNNLDIYRVDEVYKPGIILQDIINGIIESEVVIAEITPPNPNVFYELGFAHANNKPTILLAERGKELPFDIKGYRCIFYENTIRGKKDVEDSLNHHLQNIFQ